MSKHPHFLLKAKCLRLNGIPCMAKAFQTKIRIQTEFSLRLFPHRQNDGLHGGYRRFPGQIHLLQRKKDQIYSKHR